MISKILPNIVYNGDCWEWSKSLRAGYGAIRINGKLVEAHRLSYETFRGAIPIGMLVCHSCDNRKCVNPNHLFLGSYRDNLLDAVKKGRIKPFSVNAHRFSAGDVPNHSRLTTEESVALRIVIQNRGTQTLKSIADTTGQPYWLVREISSGRNYCKR